MEFNVKNMKPGYQGKPDIMRERAEKLMNNPGSHAPGPDIIFSKSAADKEKMRPFKEGGMVTRDEEEEGKMKKGLLQSNYHIEKIRKDTSKNDEEKAYKKGGSVKKCTKKFAAGGVAKIRLGQATISGKQIPKKKDPVKNSY